MAKGGSKFGAVASAAGYFYQARLALAESLRFVYGESGVEVAIERLDDVSFERHGEPLELLQTKHHVAKAGDLSDTSVDFWKTLRVWSEAVKADPSIPSRVRFALITTASAPPDSAAALLRPSAPSVLRDPAKAESLLTAAAIASGNIALEPAFQSFQALTPEMRRVLLRSVEILDHAPVIGDLEKIIEDQLRVMAPRGKAGIARELIEGWWWPRICKALQDGGGTISILDLEAKLDEIRESLKRDALPIEMEHADPTDVDLAGFDEMNFVRQLRAIGIGSIRVQYAKRDFYRAATQRSRWTRQSLLFDGEVSRYEKTLREEWEPRHAKMCGDLGDKCEDHVVRKAGDELYFWVETEARFPFRTITAKFLSVGSFHILANELRVGWHRDYLSLMSDKSDGGDGL